MDRIQILQGKTGAYRLDEKIVDGQARGRIVPLMAYMVKRPGGLAIQTFTREELAARAARGEIKRDWLVRTDAGGKWERMDEVFEAEWPAEIAAPPAGAQMEPAVDASEVASDETPPAPRSGVAPTSDRQTRWTKAAMKRYRDAYRVATFIVTVGDTVKILGAVGGAILLMLGFAGLGQHGPGVILGVAGIAAGAILGAVFLIWGIVISARGQELRAQLDVAVCESPFLNDEERAKVMSL